MKQIYDERYSEYGKVLCDFRVACAACVGTREIASLYEKFQNEDPTWSLSASQQKLIAFYWFRLVPQNFVSILATALQNSAPGLFSLARYPVTTSPKRSDSKALIQPYAAEIILEPGQSWYSYKRLFSPSGCF